MLPNKTNITVLFIVFILFIQKGHSQTDSLVWHFKGKIDQYTVTMELIIKGENCYGRYFYDKYRTDVLLNGMVQGTAIELSEINNKSSAIFRGNLSVDSSSISGTWENNNKNYQFELNRLYHPGDNGSTLQFESIRQFQELLNYYDLQLQLPVSLSSELSTSKWRWNSQSIRNKKAITDFGRVIPYRLARKYIMRPIRLKAIGPFNYYRIPEKMYLPSEFCYRSIGKLFSNQKIVGILAHLAYDTGWDSYDIGLLLIYDYNGHLIDCTEITKKLNIDTETISLTENISAVVSKDNLIQIQKEGTYIQFNSKENYHPEIKKKENLIFQILENGQLLTNQKLK